MVNELQQLISRDLSNLKKELEQYPSESTIWLKPEGINNSAGTLALHLVGNLNHFIGSVLGKTGYVRDREAEFYDRDVPVKELFERIDQTIEVVGNTLRSLTPKAIEETYPIDVFGEPIGTTKFLIHLHGHLNYHLGQVNYHRRLLARR